VGTSRKAFIGSVIGDASPDARDDGTLATVVWSIDHGAAVVRVHAVRPAVDAVRLLSEMRAIDAKAVA
jgi:dihydropteroate synthase